MLLTSPLAKQIYSFIKDAPILDYHTHLSQSEILNDQRYENLWELWLKHDHYKWRLMRGCGVDEHYITGDATPWEKFSQFAKILPLALGNPVYQWAHMELQSVFGINSLLSEDTASDIWEKANEQLKTNVSTRSLLKKFNVELICTTDDPADDLSTHLEIATLSDLPQVLPTYRPDRYHSVHKPAIFQTAIESLSNSLKSPINSFTELMTALKSRHDAFHEAGCRMSDHGLDYTPNLRATTTELETIFQNALTNQAANDTEREQFTSDILYHVAQWNHEKDWAMQLHLGPLRNVNTRLVSSTGADSGFDTMGSWPQTDRLIHFLNDLNQKNQLPKTIVYNLNPVETEPICAALQNFQEAPLAGKLQYGAAWWLVDHAPGIRRQLDTLANQTAIGTHIGMLTDGRSFASYVRHDYYRQILCSFLADKALTGEMPNDLSLLQTSAANICCNNIRQYIKATLSHS